MLELDRLEIGVRIASKNENVGSGDVDELFYFLLSIYTG